MPDYDPRDTELSGSPAAPHQATVGALGGASDTARQQGSGSCSDHAVLLTGAGGASTEAAAPRPVLRICAAPGCDGPVIGRPNRRYCSDVCGNRARVARHRSKLVCRRCGAQGTHATKDCKTTEEHGLDKKVRRDLEQRGLRARGAAVAAELDAPMPCAERRKEATAPELRTPEQQVADALDEELAAELEALERDFPGFVSGYTRWWDVVLAPKRDGSRWGVLREILPPGTQLKYVVLIPEEVLMDVPTTHERILDLEERVREIEHDPGKPEGADRAAREAVEALLADLAEQEANVE